MTSEKRSLVEIGDIRSLELACRNPKCLSAVSVSLTAEGTPGKCPSCGHSLFEPERPQYQSVNELHRALKAVLEEKIGNVRLDIKEVS